MLTWTECSLSPLYYSLVCTLSKASKVTVLFCLSWDFFLVYSSRKKLLSDLGWKTLIKEKNIGCLADLVGCHSQSWGCEFKPHVGHRDCLKKEEREREGEREKGREGGKEGGREQSHGHFTENVITSDFFSLLFTFIFVPFKNFLESTTF